MTDALQLGCCYVCLSTHCVGHTYVGSKLVLCICTPAAPMQPLNERACLTTCKSAVMLTIYIIIVFNFNCKMTKCNQCDWGCVLLSLSQWAPHCCTLPLPDTLQAPRQTTGLPGSCSHRYILCYPSLCAVCLPVIVFVLYALYLYKVVPRKYILYLIGCLLVCRCCAVKYTKRSVML